MEVTRQFDILRDGYDSLSFEDKQKIYTELYKAFPLQNEFAYDLDFIIGCFNVVQPEIVTEFGGYEGRLAYEIFKRGYNIGLWHNFELIPHKPYTELSEFHYKEIVLQQPIWDCVSGSCDLFVSVHTIEHLSDSECEQFLDWVNKQNIKYLLLITPVSPKGQDWKGYYGAHILTKGSNWIKQKLETKFKLIKEREIGKVENGGWCSLWEQA